MLLSLVNIGNYEENLTSNLYYDGIIGNGLIGTKSDPLAPNETETLTCTWNMTDVPIFYSGYNTFIDISPEIQSSLKSSAWQSPQRFK
jgi:hypothetical protein